MNNIEKVIFGFLINACVFSWLVLLHSVIVTLFSLEFNHILQDMNFNPWLLLFLLAITIYPAYKMPLEYWKEIFCSKSNESILE